MSIDYLTQDVPMWEYLEWLNTLAPYVIERIQKHPDHDKLVVQILQERRFRFACESTSCRSDRQLVSYWGSKIREELLLSKLTKVQPKRRNLWQIICGK
jgi:hypothetical protein